MASARRRGVFAAAALPACARVIVVAGFRAGEILALFRDRERVEVAVAGDMWILSPPDPVRRWIAFAF